MTVKREGPSYLQISQIRYDVNAWVRWVLLQGTNDRGIVRPTTNEKGGSDEETNTCTRSYGHYHDVGSSACFWYVVWGQQELYALA